MLQFPAWKIWIVAIVCGLGVAFAMPNVLPRDVAESLPSWMPNKQISLGLDLSGGAHLVVQIDEQAYVDGRLESVGQNIRRTLRAEQIGVRATGIVGMTVSFDLRKLEDIAAAREEIGVIADDFIVVVNDDGTITAILTEQGLEIGLSDAIERTISVLAKRIDPGGVLEPIIARQGRDRILIQVPGYEDTQELRERLGQTAQLSFHLVDSDASYADALAGNLPIGSVLLPSKDPTGPEFYVVESETLVSGESLDDASASFSDGRPVVAFSFDSVGAARFCDVTSQNTGRLLAIVLDGEVISAPRINDSICGGSGIISGSFSAAETQDLALLLRAGALPVPLTVVEERTVGPSLGADSIQAGKIAASIGFAGVIVFMVLCYGRFGLFANVALFTNLVLMLGALSLLQATLTLPGIAGIVLTVGMAVDANVLIFERIREEAGHGRTPYNAVEAGFKRAMTTILDANITTAIAALLLFFLGSGPVKGFGVTLAIGIITSMFTAIMLTRMLSYLWLRHARPQTLPI
ncbi:MAG: protein translocase subunit SecD [Rhodospirillaceae bacterium]|jgi:preprotein translocase subunit SecD|nr:protein translocase subunit SecD [Rhodospirillaceae bacterium]MBT6204581.1 protein translocase subunit SecD [Rhodospirillaceae bacterium]MBT6509210.1 protein translocase subunit SecD [Rhodospirillaceae bacterium]